GVVQVLALEQDLRAADFAAQPLGVVDRAGPADVVLEVLLERGDEGRVDAGGVVGGGQLLQRPQLGLGDKAPAVAAEVAGVIREGVEILHLGTAHRSGPRREWTALGRTDRGEKIDLFSTIRENVAALDPDALPPHTALRAFEAAARLGSVSRAADELHVTHGAVSRQIKALEAHLGVPLFEREGRGLRPTAAGLRLCEAAGEAFATLRAGVRELRRIAAGPRALVLGCPGSVLARWVIPRLDALARDLPA